VTGATAGGTDTTITGNEATTSSNNVFGVFGSTC
jgi:hypothetical protein